MLLAVALRDAAPQPTRIALFSLGNLCVYSACREALWASGGGGGGEEGADPPPFDLQLGEFAGRTGDTTARKYVARVLSKLKQPPQG